MAVNLRHGRVLRAGKNSERWSVTAELPQLLSRSWRRIRKEGLRSKDFLPSLVAKAVAKMHSRSHELRESVGLHAKSGTTCTNERVELDLFIRIAKRRFLGQLNVVEGFSSTRKVRYSAHIVIIVRLTGQPRPCIAKRLRFGVGVVCIRTRGKIRTDEA